LKQEKRLNNRQGAVLRPQLNAIHTRASLSLKWLKNIGITVIETLFLTELFLAVDIPEMLWNAEIEGKILKKIDEFVDQL
jgi:hypothetical protein